MKTLILSIASLIFLSSCSIESVDIPNTEDTTIPTPEPWQDPITPTDPVEPEIPLDQTVNPEYLIGTYFSDVYPLESETPKMIQFTSTECSADLTIDETIWAQSYYFLRDAEGTAWQILSDITVTSELVQWTQYNIFEERYLTFTFHNMGGEGNIIQVWVYDHITLQHHSFGNFTKAD